MAVPFPLQFKTKLGTGDLTLTADANESFRVYSIRIAGSTGDYLTVRIDNTTVGYFRVSTSGAGNHLFFPPIDSDRKNILERAIAGGLFRPFPIASGQKMTFSGVAVAGAVQQIIYTKHGPGEVRATEPNGSQSTEYDFISYGQVDGNLSHGDNEVTVCVNPGEFPQFPFEEVVPAKHSITLHGIVCPDVVVPTTSVADSTSTSFLKLIHERSVLADEDRNGIMLMGRYVDSDIAYGGGWSNIGFESDVDLKPALMLPTPIVFPPGDDLDVYIGLTSIAGGTTLSGAVFDVGLLMTCKKTG